MVNLPVGLRDHLPERAGRLRALDSLFLDFFDRHGYQYIISPLFEKLETFERARGTPRFEEGKNNGSQFFRALDPHRGELVAFRPDILPQIARLVCTRLEQWNLPLHFCYSGRVIRADDEPGALTREIFQVGCELIGAEGSWADGEIARLALLLMREAGLEDFKLDLGHIDFVRGFLQETDAEKDPKTFAALMKALKRRDGSALEKIPQKFFKNRRTQKAILELPHLFGNIDVLKRASALADNACSKKAIKEMKTCLTFLEKTGLANEVVLDFGEVRGFDYYTGIMMQGFSKNCSYPLLSGGRYDRLLGLFGRDLPAIGFAADLELILEALESSHSASKENTRQDGVFILGAGNGDLAGESAVMQIIKDLETSRARFTFLPGDLKTGQKLALEGSFRYLLAVPKKGMRLTLLDLKTKKQKTLSQDTWQKFVKEMS